MTDGSLLEFERDGQVWATDCHRTPGPDGNPLNSSSICTRRSSYDGCDSRFIGLFTDVCYNPTVAYDCGIETESVIPVIMQEKGDVCTGAMRCMGTECHRPNLSGANGAAFAQAAAGMEALNMMKMDMVCAETGTTPTSTSEACTPVVYGGAAMYCKIPIGNEIGLTPNCCEETEEAVRDNSPSWIDYLKGTYLIYKISENSLVQGVLSSSDVYNSTAKMFGEMAEPITNVYQSASTYITESFVEPMTASFDNLFGSFGGGGSASAAAGDIAVDSGFKLSEITNIIGDLEQMLLEHAYTFLEKTLGEDIAGMIIQKAGEGAAARYSLGTVASSILLVYQVYSLLKLIGHIIFACTEEEYEWAMNMKWRLCTYAGDCCNKKVLNLCVEKRKLYCCYKSIAARVIAEQIIKKGLVPSRTNGYRSGPNGETLKKCNINCGGFTPYELAEVDWSQVDLSEWLDVLVESGLFTPRDPGSNYGVSQNSVEVTQAVGRTEDTAGQFNQDIAAVKTVEGMSQNMTQLTENTATLRDADHCYAFDERKMPYTYPECNTTDCGNIAGSVGSANTAWSWTEAPGGTGDWMLELGNAPGFLYPEGSHDLSSIIQISDLSEISQFQLTWLGYDDWLRVELNGHQIWNGPYGGDMLQLCGGNTVRYQSSGGCDRPLELSGPHGAWNGGVNATIDVRPYLHEGANTLSITLLVGGVGDFRMQFLTTQVCD